MIVSASRRTDIPAFYAEWLLRRLTAGYALVRNPVSPHQVGRVPLTCEQVDCLVLWTRNPGPLAARLDRLRQFGIPFYFQYTITAYGRELEPATPSPAVAVAGFRQLAAELGPERVIWRYDPVILGGCYTPQWHLARFAELAAALSGATRRCVFSFLDVYASIRRRLVRSGIDGEPPSPATLRNLALGFSRLARQYGLQLESCAENLDLREWGITPARCVDPELIGALCGGRVVAGKDRNQRPACGCVASIDLGCYNSCRHGCVYCYATRDGAAMADYDPASPLLCDRLRPGDRIRERGGPPAVRPDGLPR